MTQTNELTWPDTLPTEDGRYEHYSISTQRVIRLGRIDINGLKWTELVVGPVASVSTEDAKKKALQLAVGDVWVAGYQVGEARQQTINSPRPCDRADDPQTYHHQYEPMIYIGEVVTKEEFLSHNLDDRRSKAPTLSVAGSRASHVAISRVGTVYPISAETVVLSQRDVMQQIASSSGQAKPAP